MTTVDLKNILELLKSMAEAERAIGRLYRRCAETWKMDEALWLDLEREEMQHAKNIEAMAELISRSPDRFQQQRPFNVNAVRTFIAGIEQRTDQIIKGPVARKNALIFARDIESSILEKSYHEIVKTDDPHYLDLIREVVEQTQRHKDILVNALQESRA